MITILPEWYRTWAAETVRCARCRNRTGLQAVRETLNGLLLCSTCFDGAATVDDARRERTTTPAG